MMRTPLRFTNLTTLLAFGLASVSNAADDAELARKTQNPIADLISLPLQLNHDSDIGQGGHGDRWTLNVQPVIPVSLNQDWNVISRTILPLVAQKDVAPGAGSDSGIGDIVQSLFFSPKHPTATGWIWGAGPVFLLPTGSEERLTADKWGIGPTAVLLKQESGWTYGALMNHIWSFAGDNARQDVNATFIQPFLTYTTRTFTTFGLNTESTYDWEAKTWSVPINLTVTQLLKIGGQPVSLSAGARYWAQSPDNVGPEGWGFRLTLSFLFPK